MTNLAPYELTIDEALLVNFEGKVLDISNLIGGFEIAENIFSTFMAASIQFVNAIGLIEKFPIIGEEFIVVSFSGLTTKKKTQHIFMIDSITDRSEATDKTETFVLSCHSPEWLADKFSTVDGAYLGMSVTDIITKIYKDILTSKVRLPYGDKFAVKAKKLFTDSTDGLYSFVGSMESPITSINKLLKVAQSQKYKESDYLFYETAKGFNFRAVSSLMSSDVVENYYYDHMPLTNTLDNREIKNYQAIQTITFNNSIDVMNNIEMGLYDNEVCYIDLLTKRYKEKRFIYQRDFKSANFTLLGPNRLTTKNSVFAKEQPSSPSSTFMISHDTSSYTIPYIKNRIEQTTTADPHTRWSSRRHETYNYRISKAAQLVNTLSVSILVPGNTLLKAGDLIDVFIPEKTSTKDDDHKYNHFIGSSNPTCLITSLKHVFINSKYMTILKCVKPGYEGKIKTRNI